MSLLDTLIVKLSSRCNLACTYCYEYFSGDDSWKRAPKTMAMPVVNALGRRVREYCSHANVAELNIVFHGGEPLLIGPKRLDALLTALRAAAAPAKLRYSVQTNGTLLTPAMCEVLGEHNVLVGISLDGGPEANSKRVTLKGGPTPDTVTENIAVLKSQAPHLFAVFYASWVPC